MYRLLKAVKGKMAQNKTNVLSADKNSPPMKRDKLFLHLAELAVTLLLAMFLHLRLKIVLMVPRVTFFFTPVLSLLLFP